MSHLVDLFGLSSRCSNGAPGHHQMSEDLGRLSGTVVKRCFNGTTTD